MSDDNEPYAPPGSDPEPRLRPVGPDAGPPVPGRAPARRGLDWIVRGWGYFYRDPIAWTCALVSLFVINRVLFAVPVVGLIAARVLSPLFSGGMMTGCRSVDAGGRFRYMHLFAAFSDRAAGRLAGVGGLELAMLMIVGMIFGALWVAMGLPVGEAPDPTSLGRDPWRLLLPLLILLPAVLPVIMLMLFAPVLIILHGAAVTDAMVLSYKACIRNVLPMLVWVASGIAVGVLVTLLFAVLVPLLGQTITGVLMLVLFGGVLGSVYVGSVYAAYVDIFLRAGRPAS